jgi:hypothetical protein
MRLMVYQIKQPFLEAPRKELYLYPASITCIFFQHYYRLDYHSLSYRNKDQYFGAIFGEVSNVPSSE